MSTRQTYRGPYEETLYWERVSRNLGWLGNTIEQQRERQEWLRDSVVGIVGVGGIGGAAAARLARMGFRHLKLADPDVFDVSNIQRQMGADLNHVGRNKAEVVAETVFNITRDVEIDVFPEGVNQESAVEFVRGCDYAMDQMEFFQIKNRYALHRAFRNCDRCRFILKIPTVGHTVIVYKYTKNSMTIEEVYGIDEDAELTADVRRMLVERAIAEMPAYPDRTVLDHWLVETQCIPIFGGCPPMAEGILCERLALEILEIPGVVPLPEQPGYAIFDALNWTARMVAGKWWEQ